MDLMLPRLDGWQAVRRLKADSRTSHIPVLVLTARAFVGEAEQARATGCDGYLAKPCLPDALARAIRGLIQVTDGRPAPSGARRETRRTGGWYAETARREPLADRGHAAALRCVRCKKRITMGTGYLPDTGKPAHLRCLTDPRARRVRLLTPCAAPLAESQPGTAVTGSSTASPGISDAVRMFGKDAQKP